ncbi:MAG: hypothetical protein Q7S86_02635 [bacterium]|nr:hypothetical protein [bacterium]
MRQLFKWFVALCFCTAILGSFPVFATTAGRGAEIAVPSYNGMACGRTNDKARGTATRICRSLYDNPALDPEADNMFIEYLLVESEEPSLLIWSRVMLKDAEIQFRFYRRKKGTWVFLDERIFTRRNTPEGEDTPLFSLESEFGREYQKLQCQFFESNCKVYIPAFRFPSQSQ